MHAKALVYWILFVLSRSSQSQPVLAAMCDEWDSFSNKVVNIGQLK